MRSRAALALLGTLAALAPAAVGCECGSDRESGAGTEEPNVPRAPTGTITGIVRLAEGAGVPEYADSPTQVEGRPALPESCTPPREADRAPVRPADETGGLVNLSIVVTGEDETRWPGPGEPVTHHLRIHDCRLTPPIIVATRGDRLELVNEAPENPFFVDLGDGMMQYRSEPREITLDQGGVRTVQCGFAAPCGRAEIITLYHPIHGTTGADGRFRIENVPADQPVRVTAWHPLFEEAFTMATVGAGETAEVELTIRPVAARVPAPAGTAPTEAAPGGAAPDEAEAPPGRAEDHPDPTAPF